MQRDRLANSAWTRLVDSALRLAIRGLECTQSSQLESEILPAERIKSQLHGWFVFEVPTVYSWTSRGVVVQPVLT